MKLLLKVKLSLNIINMKNNLYFIAEIGLNHNGDLSLAKEMIDAAVTSGANAVKFQSITANKLVSKTEFKKKILGGFGLDGVKTVGDFWKKVSINKIFHAEVKNYCDKKKIEFFSTPFDFESVDLLEKLSVNKYKIASGDLTHLPLLEYVAKKNKMVILSTGGSFIDEIEKSYNHLLKFGAPKVAILHCVSLYPTTAKLVNLHVIELLKQKFDTDIGFSDHTLGIHLPLAAIAKGATIIEKHFTLDKNMPGPDQAISSDPKELSELVRLGNKVYEANKQKKKIISDDEMKIRPLMRRSIVASKDIQAGETISMDNIDFKRPGDGLSPETAIEIIGKKLINKIGKDHQIKSNNIK